MTDTPTQRQPSTVVVQPVSGVTKPKTLDDWRAIFHDAVLVIVPTLVGMNLFSQDQANLWIPYVFAIADPLLSIGATQDKIRRIIYSLLLLLQTSSGIITLVTDDPQIPVLVTALATIAGGIFARFNTQTSSLVPKTRSGPSLDDVVP